MVMKRYSTLSKAPELESYHQMQFGIIFRATFSFLGGDIVGLNPPSADDTVSIF